VDLLPRLVHHMKSIGTQNNRFFLLCLLCRNARKQDVDEPTAA
jgi:hypothetical protein